MGANNLTINVADSDAVEADHVNQYGLALDGDLVPRRDGTPATRAGALGSAVHQWSEVHAQSLVVNGQSLDVSAVQGERYQIISGRTFPTGPAPDFLRAQADGSVKLLAASTPLNLVINNKNVEIDTDIDFPVSMGPDTANTAISFAEFFERGSLQAVAIGTALPIALNEQWVAFEASGNVFFGKYQPSFNFGITGFLDSPALTKALGFNFVNRDGTGTASIDPSIFTLVGETGSSFACKLINLGWVFVVDDKSVDVTYSRPIFSFTEPTSPSTGDYWFDARAMVYKKHNGTSFVTANAILVGLVAADSTGAISTRCFDFNRNYRSNPNLKLLRVDNNKASLGGNIGPISVYGRDLFTRVDADIIWDLSTVSNKQNETNYYAYLTHEGEPLISTSPPVYRARLNGFYSLLENNLCIGVLPINKNGNLAHVRAIGNNNITRFLMSHSNTNAGQIINSDFNIYGLMFGLDYKATIRASSSVAGSYSLRSNFTPMVPVGRGIFPASRYDSNNIVAQETKTSVYYFKSLSDRFLINFTANSAGAGDVFIEIMLEEYSEQDNEIGTINIEPEAS